MGDEFISQNPRLDRLFIYTYFAYVIYTYVEYVIYTYVEYVIYTYVEYVIYQKIMRYAMINDNENIRTTKGSSKMAEGIALQRLAESQLPEDIRIFCDQYATYFINRHVLEWAKEHPIEARVMAEEYERKMPGWSNSIRARIRYFDDIIQNAATDGFRQLVILGAGYDTRAYRIDSLKNGIKVFEVDNLSTIKRKKEIVKEIFGKFPSHVTFVPFDLEDGNLWEQMKTAGYSPALKTLFILEGLLMYLSYDAVFNLFFRNCEKLL